VTLRLSLVFLEGVALTREVDGPHIRVVAREVPLGSLGGSRY